MDPEAGDEQPRGSQGGGDGAAGPNSGVSKLPIALLQALWERLRAVLANLAPEQKAIGVENRFYYDETEKMWKLQGGETEQERLESEALRYHTSRGLSGALAPATTACDTTRAAVMEPAGPPPPPPTGGPVTQALRGGTGGDVPGVEGYSHPVYAPASSFTGANNVAPPPRQAPVRAPVGPPPAARSSPFGAAAAAPITSPFGAAPASAAPAPQTSPFAGGAATAPATIPAEPPAPVTAPVAEQPGLGQPGGAAPMQAAFPGAPTPLASAYTATTPAA